MVKDSKGQRKMEDFGGGLLPAVEGHSLEQNRSELEEGVLGCTKAETRESWNILDLSQHASCIPFLWWSSAFLCQSGELQKIQVLSWMCFSKTNTKLNVIVADM